MSSFLFLDKRAVTAVPPPRHAGDQCSGESLVPPFPLPLPPTPAFGILACFSTGLDKRNNFPLMFYLSSILLL